MKAFNLTTVLNIKIVGIVFFVMFLTASYNHWLSIQKENNQHIEQMMAITDFILDKKPLIFLSKFNDLSKTEVKTTKEELQLLNHEIQPLLKDICIPISIFKFGIYSEKYQRIIALGPEVDNNIFFDIKPEKFQTLQQISTPKLTYEDCSILWYGAKAITYSKPIYENGILVGHVFASVNQDIVISTIWERTINSFLGAFVMLIICIIIFRELFLKLKNDLTLFAESIVTDSANTYQSKFPEFTPVLNYISQQTKKMTSLDRLNIVGEMAAGIAHEIRNPMTTVRGLLQFMQRKKEIEHYKENFSLMIDELDRANKIITEFLSLSKDKAFEFHEENLNTIINAILPLLQANILYNNSLLTLNLNPVSTMLADKNSIRQLILNLVKNSLDAMHTGGKITITTTQVDNKINLSIKDSGVGIPSDIQSKLGTPFFTTKENGTGLGLAICYRIVHRHDATLIIDSQLNQGTTCTISFNALIPK